MKLKKIVLAVVISSIALVSTVSAASFTDTRGHWAEDIINDLADSGILSGVSETHFNPDNTVTRAEFLRMSLGAKGIETVSYREGECLDVKSGAWYADTVQTALDNGFIPEAMIEGYAAHVVSDENSAKAVYSGVFNPETPITREEMAYIAQAVYQYSLGEDGLDRLEVPPDLSFDDTSRISTWAMDGVKHAYANSIIQGMGDGNFAPRDTATRAQAASIIMNLISI